jgi:hypothetical protein
MNKEEREREKEIRYLMYLKSQLIKQTKKELSLLREELNSLGNNKERREGYEEGPKMVRRKKR